jgi:hypothetical protein
MTYIDTYAQRLSEVQADISKCEETGHRVVFGYKSDLVIVLHY